jgi:hypothetical protein
MLSVLLSYGAVPGAKDSDRCTILHYAVRSGDIDTVHIAAAAVSALKAKKGGLDAWDRWKRTAAAWALHLGFNDLLKVLELYRAKLNNLEDSLKDTSLHSPGEWSDKTTMQRSLRPERKKDAPVKVLSALINTMHKYANGEVDVATGSQATAALRDLVCANSENRENVRELGVIPILIKLVKEYSDVNAVGTIRNLPYRNPINAQACGDAGAVEVLAEAIMSRPPSSVSASRIPSFDAAATTTADNNQHDFDIDTDGGRIESYENQVNQEEEDKEDELSAENENDHSRRDCLRLQHACAAALHGLQFRCEANVQRIAAIAGLEAAISELFSASSNVGE